MDSNQESQTQQPTNPTPNPINNSSKSKVVLIILGVAAVIIIAIGAYLLGTKQSQPVVQNSILPTPLPTEASAKVGIDETANWKTYTNEKYKLSFKYPLYLIDLAIDPDKDNGKKMLNKFFRSEDKEISLEVDIAFAREDLAIGRGAETSKIILKETIKIGDYDGDLYVWETDITSPIFTDPTSDFYYGGGDISIENIYSVLLENKPLSVIYSGPKDRVSIEEFNQILSTFKFTP